MESGKLSLAGLIERNWIESGQPRLTWDDLLKSAIAADIQLEKLGLNPAKKFRVLRLAHDSAGMFQYIAGYYQYDFCPSFSGVDRNYRPQGNTSSTSLATNRDIVNLYRTLYAEHPHHLLPLETSLPKELKFDARDQYRIILTMILSQRMGDCSLSIVLLNCFLAT